MTFGSLHAQLQVAPPKLVVTLTIDQLRTDYLEAFSPLYGEGGFKRLLRDGKVFRRMEMPFRHVDRASAVASIYSGCSPSTHGIIAGRWMNAETLRPVDCVDDPGFMGNYTDENTSPSKLLVSTLADELRIATRNRGMVYSVSPFRDAAVLAAGHAGNAAFWLNGNTGKWCSTTYYQDFPWWMNDYNTRYSPDHGIKAMAWEPALPSGRYVYLPEWRTAPFMHKFANEGDAKFRRLITSPLVNDEVNRLAEELVVRNGMGEDSIPDLLALTYYAGNYAHRSTADCGMEVQDAYVRIDRSIASLLDMLERHVGLRNIVFCLASTGYADNDGADPELYRIPGGEFYLNRCATLLNMYLMATYGEGQYVEAYYDRQIYLNHKLIEDKRLGLADIQEKAAEFLVQFSGVDEVYYANRLLLGEWSPRNEPVRNGFHRKRSGDLLIEVLPGWTVIQEDGTNHSVVRASSIPTPLILLGPDIKPEIVSTPVCANRIAPTLASVMRIRAPNACRETPL